MADKWLNWIEAHRIIIGTVMSFLIIGAGSYLAYLDWHAPQTTVVSRTVSRTTVPASMAPTSSPMAVTGLININQASAAELDTLPGIGPTYASRIVEYRQTVGPFHTPHDIVKVKGIGEGTYAKIQALISI